MSELRTVLDLAETWADRRRMRRHEDAEDIARVLAAIPADAVEQIARMRATLKHIAELSLDYRSREQARAALGDG